MPREFELQRRHVEPHHPRAERPAAERVAAELSERPTRRRPGDPVDRQPPALLQPAHRGAGLLPFDPVDLAGVEPGPLERDLERCDGRLAHRGGGCWQRERGGERQDEGVRRSMRASVLFLRQRPSTT